MFTQSAAAASNEAAAAAVSAAKFMEEMKKEAAVDGGETQERIINQGPGAFEVERKESCGREQPEPTWWSRQLEDDSWLQEKEIASKQEEDPAGKIWREQLALVYDKFCRFGKKTGFVGWQGRLMDGKTFTKCCRGSSQTEKLLARCALNVCFGVCSGSRFRTGFAQGSIIDRN